MKKRFIFDENYIKRYARRNRTRWLVVIMCILIFISVIIVVLLINRNNRNRVKPIPKIPVYELKEEMVLESGSTLPEVVDYFKKLENIDVNDIEVIYPEEFEISYDMSSCSEKDLEKINDGDEIEDYDCAVPILKTPTTYGITIKLLDKEYTVNLKIEDKTAPFLELKDLEILKDERYDIEDFVQSCYDATDGCRLSYPILDLDQDGNIIDYSRFKDPGEYTIKIIAEDDYENKTAPMETKLTIVEPKAEVFMVIFDPNGGSPVASVKVEAGKTIMEPDNPTRNGYLFTGWYLNDQLFDFNGEINNDVVLTAKWQKIESSGNSGSEGNGSQVVPKPPVVPGVVNVTSVWVSYQQIFLDVNESKTVTAKVYPENATNKTVTWKSNNSSIAKVVNGVITGVKTGTTTITASAGGKSASVTVVVRGNTTSASCKYGDTNYNSSKYILSVKVAADNCAVNPNTTYNENVSRIDYNRLFNQDLPALGYNVANLYNIYSSSYVNVKNNAGTGLVGYQITITVNINGRISTYIINPDNSRKFLRNDLGLK